MALMKCGACKKAGEAKEIVAMVKYQCLICLAVNEVANVPLKEWVGFDYQKFLQDIKDFISEDSFKDLAALTEADIIAGKFTEKQIQTLKDILKTSFTKGESIKQMAEHIQNEIPLKDALRTSDGKVVTDAEGNPVVQIAASDRPLAIARTEATRAAAGGALYHYEDAKVENVRFLSAQGARTCTDCSEMNGQVYQVESAYGIIPVHPLCRCTWIPVTDLG